MFLHGVVKGQLQDLRAKIGGVAGKIAFRPAPIGVLDDHTGEGEQPEVAAVGLDDLEPASFEQRGQIGFPRVPDLFAGQRRRRFLGIRGVGYSLCSISCYRICWS